MKQLFFAAALLMPVAAWGQTVGQQVDAATADASGAVAVVQQTLAAMRNQIKADQAQIADLQKQLADAKKPAEVPK